MDEKNKIELIRKLTNFRFFNGLLIFIAYAVILCWLFTQSKTLLIISILGLGITILLELLRNSAYKEFAQCFLTDARFNPSWDKDESYTTDLINLDTKELIFNNLCLVFLFVLEIGLIGSFFVDVTKILNEDINKFLTTGVMTLIILPSIVQYFNITGLFDHFLVRYEYSAYMNYRFKISVKEVGNEDKNEINSNNLEQDS